MTADLRKTVRAREILVELEQRGRREPAGSWASASVAMTVRATAEGTPDGCGPAAGEVELTGEATAQHAPILAWTAQVAEQGLKAPARTVTVTVIPADGGPARTFTYFECFPTGLSLPDSTGAEETFRFAYNSFRAT